MVELKKTRMVPLLECQKKCDDMSICLDTIGYRHWVDGRTDGISETISRFVFIAC